MLRTAIARLLHSTCLGRRVCSKSADPHGNGNSSIAIYDCVQQYILYTFNYSSDTEAIRLASVYSM